MLHKYLLANSGVAKVLSENSDEPFTLEELLMSYCETHERFTHVVKLLEKLPQFEIDALKTSNCMIDGTLPYDSLVGLSKSDLETLYELIDYLDLPKKLHEKLGKVIDKGTIWRPYTITEFTKNGDLRGMKYLHEEKGVQFGEDTCMYAAANGHLECLKYAHTQGCPWDTDTCMHAAANGHLECLKYAHEQGCLWNAWICAYAARYGQLECLKYAHAPTVGESCSWNIVTCKYAAMNGYLECLKYAHTQGCPWNEYTCTYAALNGHLECLKYAHTQGCHWNEKTCAYAALNGHLECLKYARTEGCPWDKDTCLRFTSNDEICKWIEENCT